MIFRSLPGKGRRTEPGNIKMLAIAAAIISLIVSIGDFDHMFGSGMKCYKL
jgi:hypothetical protein